MEVLIHVVIALSSVAYTTYACVAASRMRLRISYALIGMTLITGLYLIALNPDKALQATVSGTLYLVVMTLLTAVAQKRLSQTVALGDNRR